MDLWVAVKRIPFDPMGLQGDGRAGGILRRMQETLIALGRVVDENSRWDLRRWLRLVHEGQAIFRSLSIQGER